MVHILLKICDFSNVCGDLNVNVLQWLNSEIGQKKQK